jgi:hypothetical protein
MSQHVSNDLKARARALAAAESIPYSAALTRLRTPHAETRSAPEAPRPTTFIVQDYLYVPFPAPDLRGARPCDECAGTGLDADGTTFASPSDGGRPPLLVEVVCNACEGCGRAEHDIENGCGLPHTDPDMNEDLEEREEAPDCYSCSDVGFYYVQGFTTGEDGEPEEVLYVRQPCGCTEDRMRVIMGEPVEVPA